MSQRPRVRGIGGVFFKSEDPAGLAEWYRRHLDFPVAEWGGAQFFWQQPDAATPGYTVWSPFRQSSEYFQPSSKPFMLNLRVDDLRALLATLRAEGCNVLDREEDCENGRFGYVLDPEGTLIELWQPAADDPSLPSAPSEDSTSPLPPKTAPSDAR